MSRLEQLPAESWQPIDPPALQLPASAEPAKPKPARSRRLVLRPAIAIAACAALLVVGAGAGALIAGGDGTTRGGTQFGLAPLGPADPAAKATAKLTRGPNGKLKLNVSGLEPTRNGDFYEIWMSTAATTWPRSAPSRFQTTVRRRSTFRSASTRTGSIRGHLARAAGRRSRPLFGVGPARPDQQLATRENPTDRPSCLGVVSDNHYRRRST